jgi:hypothetical protein
MSISLLSCALMLGSIKQAPLKSDPNVLINPAFKDGLTGCKQIVLLPGSKMPSVSDTEIPKGNFPWLNLAGRHVLVTYRHADRWEGPLATYSADRLPRTLANLKAQKPLTVVAYGDSITLGINGSGYRGDPPYTPK